jgi:hypothetical protein
VEVNQFPSVCCSAFPELSPDFHSNQAGVPRGGRLGVSIGIILVSCYTYKKT